MPVISSPMYEMKINQINAHQDLQSRKLINPEVVKQYAEAIQTGCVMPPIHVFKIVDLFYVVDGFHRLEAHKQIKLQTIKVQSVEGDMESAAAHSIISNITHGLQRTLEDKRRAINMALNNEHLMNLSTRELSQKLGVSHQMIDRARTQLKKDKPQNKFTPKVYLNVKDDDKAEVRVLAPLAKPEVHYENYENYDPRDDTLKELVQEVEELKDRLSIRMMEATDEEKEMAAQIIKSLREENQSLSRDLNSMKINRNDYQNKAAQAISQCNSQQYVIKKLNKEIAELRKKNEVLELEKAVLF
jgi:uncharacterized small protein (DUF1192 family)